MFFRSKKRLTDVTELNQLLVADNDTRTRLVGEMSEPVVKGLLVYLLANGR